MVLDSTTPLPEELSESALLAALKQRGIYLSAANGRLKVNAPAGALDDSLKEVLRRRKPALLALLGQDARMRDEKPLVPLNTTGPIPLTAAQQSLWVAAQFTPESTAYSMPQAFLVEAPVSPDALRKAVAGLVRRHEILRTYFAINDGEVAQMLAEDGDLPVEFTDLSGMDPGSRDAAGDEILRAAAKKPFDLLQPPLLRIHLIRLDEQRHLIFINVHHIIADLHSLSILRSELLALYVSAENGQTAPLPPLPVQYRDYSIWERERLTEDLVQEQIAYWNAKLDGAPGSPVLPFARPRSAAPSFLGRTKTIEISKTVSDALSSLGREMGASLFMTLMAAFAVLLYRYSGETDFCVGMPITRRNRIETESLIGLFVNLLVLRAKPSGDLTFREFLAQVRETALEAYAHSDVPFQKIMEGLHAGSRNSSTPLFQVVFTLDPAADRLGESAPAINVHPGAAKFDLTLELVEECDGIHGAWEYSTDLFDDTSIEMLSRAFLSLLEGVVENADCSLRQFNLAGPASNPAPVEADYPRDSTIHEVFTRQAQLTPDAVALEWGDSTLTYAELDRKTNQLARFLQQNGAGKDSLVGLSMSRSPDAIVGMLAILKAGGAYVPLDPSYPKERLKHFLDDTNLAILLTLGTARSILPANKARVICLDKDWPEIGRQSDEPLETRGTAEDLAYVMYTSGSTGRPNGVLVTHRGVVRLVKNTNYAKLDETEVFLQFAPVAFDASTFEIWAPLLNGGRLALMPAEESTLGELGRAIERYGVTTLWLTAGLFHAIVDERIAILRPLRQLLAGGDVLSPKHVYRFLDEIPECRLINGYGPTENTTFTCCYTVPRDIPRRGSIPIGIPVSHTDVYLLDADLAPVAPGAPGELYFGGDGLARGYLNNPELTAEKFIPNPFSDRDGARLLRSGDLARYLPDGSLEFLGRKDTQVKINGFRIETGEIEAVLSGSSGIADAVVIAREDVPGRKYLAAYVVPVRGAETAHGHLLQLRKRLLKHLPAHMQPGTITVLQRLPLTANGKVDRAALPPPGHLVAGNERARTAPPDEMEARLLEIWEEVLGIRPIRVTDDFFNLGGHSVLALRLVAKIETEWGLRLPLSILLKAPTVEALARVLRQGSVSASWTSLVGIQVGGSRPPLFIVSGVGGNVVRFRDLARHLGGDQPVFALQPPGLDRRQPYITRLEDLAAHHVREIRAKQKTGPYHLAGYSFGGAVVFEMARQLEEQGQEIALVALLDAPEWHYAERALAALGWRHLLSRVAARIRKLIAGPGRIRYISERLKRLVRHTAIGVFRLLRMPLPARFVDIVDVNTHAVSRYRPRPFRGKVVLLKTRESSGIEGSDPTLGWSALAEGGVDVFDIPGNHEDLTTEPNVQFLAQILTSCLLAPAKTESIR
ncbi:MAG TPA: amino acid adenylation domain-containing protein [Bryobacteraceae bacterium]|jgi:aspartate racemase|nr:amino acid adenylation domain-containing protein [Bryobacteraceae bacterium]